MDRTIPTCLNQRKELTVTYGQTELNYSKAQLLQILTFKHIFALKDFFLAEISHIRNTGLYIYSRRRKIPSM